MASHGDVKDILKKNRCSFVSDKGIACRCYALRDSSFCYYHDMRPEIVAKRKTAQKRGGKSSKRIDRGIPSWSSQPIQSIGDLKDVFSQLLNAGICGEISTARLSALSSVANILIKVLDQAELEKRVDGLERIIKENHVD